MTMTIMQFALVLSGCLVAWVGMWLAMQDKPTTWVGMWLAMQDKPTTLRVTIVVLCLVLMITMFSVGSYWNHDDFVCHPGQHCFPWGD